MKLDFARWLFLHFLTSLSVALFLFGDADASPVENLFTMSLSSFFTELLVTLLAGGGDLDLAGDPGGVRRLGTPLRLLGTAGRVVARADNFIRTIFPEMITQ